MNNLFSKVNLSLFRFLFVLIIASLVSCGGDSGEGGAPITAKQAEEALPNRVQAAEKSIKHLKSSINQGFIRNTVILKEYANILKKQKPEMSSLIDNLAMDASTDGAMFNNLQQRLDVLKNSPELFETPNIRYKEANAIIDAAQTSNYNLALTDIVNVLADMSNGSLARINSEQKAESLSTNNAQDLGAGSQLIGNPAYGQWNNHGGTSVWEWYGMYAMFRDLVGGRSYSYDHWNRNRDWSYHSDIGRDRYSSQRTASRNAPKTKKYSSVRDYGVSKKSYGSSSAERRTSTYGSSANKTSSSSYSKKSSNVGGSFRNKSTYSRSSFGGK